MLTQSLDEIVNVSADDLDAHRVRPTDFLRNACLVPSVFYEFENSRANDIERKHLTAADIKDDSSIFCLRASNCIGGI